MSNLPPGVEQWMLDSDEHFEECAMLPEGSECICAEIEEAEEDARINNMVDDYLLEKAQEGEIPCQI